MMTIYDTTKQGEDHDGPYTVRSVKAHRTYADLSLDEAIKAAKAHNEELQPAYGTEVVNARGDVVWSSEDES